MVGQVTGGNPRTTGIYYDEVIAKDLNRIESGQGIPDLYKNGVTDLSKIFALRRRHSSALRTPMTAYPTSSESHSMVLYGPAESSPRSPSTVAMPSRIALQAVRKEGTEVLPETP